MAFVGGRRIEPDIAQNTIVEVWVNDEDFTLENAELSQFFDVRVV